MADVTSPFGFPYPEPTDLVRDGATDIEALAQAANDQFSAGFQFAGQRIYTSSGVFAKADPLGTGDIGLRAIRVTVVGGGGAGGGSVGADASAGAGGGAGGYAQSFVTVSALASSETVVRGAGGSAVSANTGNAGADSSFGSLVVATGGNGGLVMAGAPPVGTVGGFGGSGTAGDITQQGGGGGAAHIMGNSGNSIQSGFGGNSFFGGGQRNAQGNNSGNTAVTSGAGGSGAATGPGNTDRLGGAGANGIVIVEVFV